jgi:hypothetical protein
VLRIVLTRPFGEPKKTLRLPIDVNHFVTKITVSPVAGDWFYELVTDLAEKYKVSAQVAKSDLTSLIEKAKK